MERSRASCAIRAHWGFQRGDHPECFAISRAGPARARARGCFASSTGGLVDGADALTAGSRRERRLTVELTDPIRSAVRGCCIAPAEGQPLPRRSA